LKSFYFLFIAVSFLAGSCAQTQVKSDFYRGLVIKSAQKNSAEAARYFQKALKSQNEYVRQAAAEELANLMYEGTALSSKTIESIRREAAGVWADAFGVLGDTVDKEKTLSFLFGLDDGVYKEAAYFVIKECEKRGVLFSEAESAAIEGHFSTLNLRYNDALNSFRGFKDEEKWLEKLPPVFSKYPVLINDLGRAFQYTSSGGEGLDLFLNWEKNLAPGLVNADAEKDLRYRLLFYAGRIARRKGSVEQAVNLFEKALPFAPNAEQSDATIWYILDLSAGGSLDVFIQRLEKLIPLWNNDGLFTDVLEKFLHGLVLKRDWGRVVRTFSLIKDRNSAASAGYAYIIARVIEEGYFSAGDLQLAAKTMNKTEANTGDFFKFAYNAGRGINIYALYYHLQSAAALDLPFFKLAEETENPPEKKEKPLPAMQFLMGFFDNNAESFSPRYIRALEKNLPVRELRVVAQALVKAGMYGQAMRVSTQYIVRENLPLYRTDMELLFPQPYRELIEKYANKYGFTPSLIYGLVRTESAFQSAVVSRAGATGLAQLMPKTANDMAEHMRKNKVQDYFSDGSLNLNDPDLNLHIGIYYLRYLMGLLDENEVMSLMSYNGGMNRVRRWKTAAKTLPEDLYLETVTVHETRDYGKRVLTTARIYQELYYQQEK